MLRQRIQSASSRRSRRLKIALLAARLPPAYDGVGDHADRLARTLQRLGHEVVVITAGSVPEAPGYPVERLGSTWGARAAIRAAAVLRTMRPDGIVVEYTPFLYGARSLVPIAVLIAARSLRIRSAIVVHEAFYARGSDALKSALKAGLSNLRDTLTLVLADRIAVPGAARAQAIALRLPIVRDRLDVVPIGANIEAPAAFRREPLRPARIVMFGVVSRRRRLELALEAVAQLVREGTSVCLDVIGRIYEADYAQMIAERAQSSGIGERVVFHGELPAEALSATLGAATVAVHAAREGAIASSGSLLALLAHGLPVLAVRTAHDDPIFNGAVRYVDDGAALLAALREVVADPATGDELAAAALERWRSTFHWDRVAAGIVSALLPRTAADDAGRGARK